MGSKAITHSDIVNEIKLILIINGQTWSEERREELQTLAINQTLKRNIRKVCCINWTRSSSTSTGTGCTAPPSSERITETTGKI